MLTPDDLADEVDGRALVVGLQQLGAVAPLRVVDDGLLGQHCNRRETNELEGGSA